MAAKIVRVLGTDLVGCCGFSLRLGVVPEENRKIGDALN
jgi:hypothetical protein